MTNFLSKTCFKLFYFICGSKTFPSKQEQKVFKKRNSNEFISTRTIENNQLEQQTQNLQISSLHRKHIETKQNHQSKSNFIVKKIFLYRNNLNQKLGLTLSYHQKLDKTTNVYIEQIEKNSIAEFQGDLRRGDQIIQINNQPIFNRDQFLSLIEETLLISLIIIRLRHRDFNENYQSKDKDSNQIKLTRTHSNSLSNSLSNRNSFNKNSSNRWSSLINLKFSSLTENSVDNLTCSEILFGITTDNEQFIVQPLPFYQNTRTKSDEKKKMIRRRVRTKYPKREKSILLTTDDDNQSEFKQGRYWTKQQRKQQLLKSKRSKEFSNFTHFHSTTEDFHLLNRIFLRENEEELNEKPYLAIKYQEQYFIEKENLNNFLHQYSKSVHRKQICPKRVFI